MAVNALRTTERQNASPYRKNVHTDDNLPNPEEHSSLEQKRSTDVRTSSLSSLAAPDRIQMVENNRVDKIASAKLDVLGDISVGVGVKNPNGELIFNLPLSSIKAISQGRPFTVSVDTKFKNGINIAKQKGSVEFQGKLNLTFTSLNSPPRITADGYAIAGIENTSSQTQVGSYNRKDTLSTFAGVAVKYTPERGFQVSPTAQRKPSSEYSGNLAEVSPLPGVTIEGRGIASTLGNHVIAAIGILGGEKYPGENVTTANASGKISVTSPTSPLTVVLKGSANLTIANDDQNGLLQLRIPAGVDAGGKAKYKIIGEVNLPKVVESINNTAKNFVQQVEQNIPGLSQVRAIFGFGTQSSTETGTAYPTLTTPQIQPKPLTQPQLYLDTNALPQLAPYAQPLPIKTLGNDQTIKNAALKNPNSTESYLVGALNDAVNAPQRNPEFAQQLRDLKPNNGDITDATADRQGRSVNLRWSKQGSYLRVEARREGDATTYFHQVTANRDGTFRWGPTTSPARQNAAQKIVPQTALQALPKPSTVLPFEELGSDLTLKRATLKNNNSNEAYLVGALNDAVNAPKNNPEFAKLLSELKPYSGGITDSVSDQQGKKVNLRWSMRPGYLRVEARREGEATTYFHQVTANRDGTFKWSPTLSPVRQNAQQATTPQASTETLPKPSTVLPFKILGSDNSIKRAALKNPNSNEAFMVRIFNNIIDAPRSNAALAKRIADLKMTDQGISDRTVDAKGNNIYTRVTKGSGYLQVSIKRDNEATTYYHRVTENRNGSYNWTKNIE